MRHFDPLGYVRRPLEAAQQATNATVDTYGFGACGPRGFYGTTRPHMSLEADLAKLLGTESAIAYSAGVATASSVLPALVTPTDRVIVDSEAVVSRSIKQWTPGVSARMVGNTIPGESSAARTHSRHTLDKRPEMLDESFRGTCTAIATYAWLSDAAFGLSSAAVSTEADRPDETKAGAPRPPCARGVRVQAKESENDLVWAQEPLLTPMEEAWPQEYDSDGGDNDAEKEGDIETFLLGRRKRVDVAKLPGHRGCREPLGGGEHERSADARGPCRLQGGPQHVETGTAWTRFLAGGRHPGRSKGPARAKQSFCNGRGVSRCPLEPPLASFRPFFSEGRTTNEH